ncbi:MAG: cell wall-binding repeat-containing protein [Candidatus Andersenbacteria bacterium]
MRLTSKLTLTLLVTVSLFASVAPQSVQAASKADPGSEVVPTLKASLATVELTVGAGQTYATLQAAINAIPATPTQNYTILVAPGTYLSESTLTGKNNGPAGAVITIKNAATQKPLFIGGAAPTTWFRLSGTNDVYTAPSNQPKFVTDGLERLKHVASVNDVKRQRNVWTYSGGNVVVRLLDYADPNTRPVTLTTGSNGLKVVNVPNVLVEGLLFKHYAGTGITFDNAGSSSARSIWASDIGDRGSNDAGVLVKNSPNDSALNIIGSEIYGAAVRAVNSTSFDVYNGSFHHSNVGIDLESSTNALLQNNLYGSALEDPVRIDTPSKSGLTTRNNSYWNPSGALGAVGGSAKYTVGSLGAAAGGESGSNEADPRYRSTSTRESDKTNFLHNTVRDLDAALFGGEAWSNNTNAANLRWDQGFMFESYLDMYRATKDTRWLAKIVDQADNVWANCTDNPATPGSTDDGYCGWTTSRYARAMVKPSVGTSGNGVTFKVLDSAGTPVNGDLGIYGPGNADGLLSKKLELRFTSPSKYDVWDVTGTPVALATNVTYAGAGLTPQTLDDPTIESAVNYDVKVYFCCNQSQNEYPVGGDVYKIETKAKKQLEYENIEGGLLAPLIEFAVEVLGDPTLQGLPVAGSTYLAKAQDYITKVDTEIYPKWEPYFKTSGSSIWAGGPGGVYRWPTDEQYAIPGNTLPVNQSADLAQLWVRMYQATGDTKYKTRAKQVADWFKSKLEVRTATDGQSFFYWRYYYPALSTDAWQDVISEDVNHGGVVIKFVEAAREAGITFTDSDLALFGRTFSSQLWKPSTGSINWYLDGTLSASVASRIYYFHSWAELPGNTDVAKLVYEAYANNSYSSVTGVVYQMMSDAALVLSRLAGTENYKVRAGSPAIRSGSSHGYDRDFDGRSRSQLGAFDRGAYSFITLDRLEGANRYETAIAISQNQFSQDKSAGAVFLARGDQFADGLAGAPLAAQENAPILLTSTATLQPEVLAEIERVLPEGGKVWLLGGESAISAAVADALSAAGFAVTRLAGANRYETAVQVAEQLEHLTQVFLASGTSFPDALAASSIAARDRAAIVLTTKDALPQVTEDFLKKTPATSIHIVGGSAVVSDDVFDAADPYGTVDRTAGSNRYETAVQLAQTFYPSADTVSFSTGTNFPDSLVAGPLVGSQQLQAPLLLVQPDAVPEAVADYLAAYGAQVMGGVLFGGTSAISAGVETDLESSL